MEMVVFEKGTVIEKIYNQISGDTDLDFAIAEFIRRELWARGISYRKSLLNRTAGLIGFTQLDTTSIRDCLDGLEKNGDITKGPDGMVAAAPLRAVAIGKNHYELHGTLPTRVLNQLLPTATESYGLGRFVRIAQKDHDPFIKALEACSGIIISAQRWSGVDRASPADNSWLIDFDNQLQQATSPTAFSNQDGLSDWRGYFPGPEHHTQKERWQKPDERACRLWRAWHERGWWVFAWTDGAVPDDGYGIKLNSDDATRTMFALDRELGFPLIFDGYSSRTQNILEIDAFLPAAEYRYLNTLGACHDTQETKRIFVFRSEIWVDIFFFLGRQIGVGFNVSEDRT